MVRWAKENRVVLYFQRCVRYVEIWMPQLSAWASNHHWAGANWIEIDLFKCVLKPLCILHLRWFIWRFPEIDLPPSHPFLMGILHYKPSIVGYPHFRKPPYDSRPSKIDRERWVSATGMIIGVSWSRYSQHWTPQITVSSTPVWAPVFPKKRLYQSLFTVQMI